MFREFCVYKVIPSHLRKPKKRNMCPKFTQHVTDGPELNNDTKVFKDATFKSKLKFHLRGCMVAAMASEATKMALRGNMHLEARVINVTDFIISNPK